MIRRLIVSFAIASTAFAALPHTPKTQVHAPKLVIAIIVDEMRADYIDRFGQLFGEGGFRLLTTQGTLFTECAYDYATTFTAPGHSLFLSGIPVRTSGIIGNEWYDRDAGRVVYCVEDSSVRSLGIDPLDQAGRMSPRRFQGSTLGDRLKSVSRNSRVVGLSIKDRGAILPAGSHPTGAFWFDPQSGNWISSTYYGDFLPAWVQRYNALRQPEGYFGKTWDKSLPDSSYGLTGNDDSPGEGVLPGELRPVFPHTIGDLASPAYASTRRNAKRFEALITSPYGNELTTHFAEAAIEGERLGKRGVTDILAVSFSSPDYCGHIFGPDSQEMEDMIARLDGTLKEFFLSVQSRLGPGNVMIVLTADHGVCPLPERSFSASATRINPGDVLTDIKVRLGQQFNYNEGQDNLIQSLSNGFLYLDQKGIRSHGFAPDRFGEEIERWALREQNIAHCFTRRELEGGIDSHVAGDTLKAILARSFSSARSGDIALVPAEYSFFAGGSTGTTHGSPYWYDRHAPLLMFGPGIPAGRSAVPCRPDDIAPTIARILGITPPDGCDGRPLSFPGTQQPLVSRAPH